MMFMVSYSAFIRTFVHGIADTLVDSVLNYLAHHWSALLDFGGHVHV